MRGEGKVTWSIFFGFGFLVALLHYWSSILKGFLGFFFRSERKRSSDIWWMTGVAKRERVAFLLGSHYSLAPTGVVGSTQSGR